MSSLLKAIERAQAQSPDHAQSTDQALDSFDYTNESGNTGQRRRNIGIWLVGGLILAALGVYAGMAFTQTWHRAESTQDTYLASPPSNTHAASVNLAITASDEPVNTQQGSQVNQGVVPQNQQTEALYASVDQTASPNESASAMNDSLWRQATPIAELPLELMVELAAINYSAHVFNPESGEGFAFINGRRLEAGSFLGIAQVQALVEQGTVFKAQGVTFRVAALQDWELQLD